MLSLGRINRHNRHNPSSQSPQALSVYGLVARAGYCSRAGVVAAMASVHAFWAAACVQQLGVHLGLSGVLQAFFCRGYGDLEVAEPD